jgi:hypothetical protein
MSSWTAPAASTGDEDACVHGSRVRGSTTAIAGRQPVEIWAAVCSIWKRVGADGIFWLVDRRGGEVRPRLGEKARCGGSSTGSGG